MSEKPARPFIPVRFAVLTVSDSRSLEEDRSGSTLQSRIEEAGHILSDRKICTDDKQSIADIVTAWSKDEAVDVVITTGGTGFTGRDVTPDALEPLFEKTMNRFSEVLRQDRHIDHSKPRHGWSYQPNLRLRAARLSRRL